MPTLPSAQLTPTSTTTSTAMLWSSSTTMKRVSTVADTLFHSVVSLSLRTESSRPRLPARIPRGRTRPPRRHSLRTHPPVYQPRRVHRSCARSLATAPAAPWIPTEVHGDTFQVKANVLRLGPGAEVNESVYDDVRSLLAQAIRHVLANNEFLVVEKGGQALRRKLPDSTPCFDLAPAHRRPVRPWEAQGSAARLTFDGAKTTRG
jgi:hypothetical protein